ncbi:MAG TPA: caspase family protein [Leptolyngbyaceae cyanobacterium]
MKRRSFLQRAGWVLAALGVGEAGLMAIANRYYQALAQPTPRKLAILVGINQYAGSSLAGCVTDVELQQELLIHRFGFLPSDILAISDREATRQNIETALIEHLAKQAKPGDVVVFHFSGYGSCLKQLSNGDGELVTGEQGKAIENVESPIANTPSPIVQNILLPVDALLATKSISAENAVLEETLYLLLRSLSTDKVTAILDTSYTDPGALLWGSLRVRSQSAPADAQPISPELDFQKQLRENSPNSGLFSAKNTNSGVILTAAGPDRSAMEGQLDGFTAGLFTYALTQYLWQSTPPTTIQISLSQAASTVVQLVGKNQQPRLLTANDSNLENPVRQTWLTDLDTPPSHTGFDGVVIGVEDNGKTGLLWLGGITPSVLPLYGANSILTVLPAGTYQTTIDIDKDKETTSTKPLQLIVRSRDGLKSKAQIFPQPNEIDLLQPGQLVQEAVRVIPRNVNLRVAIGSSLERIERVDATSAFSGVRNVSLVTANEQPADCVLGRVQKPALNTGLESSQVSSPSPQYGLFSPALNPIPNTLGEAGEAVKTAVQRLYPKYRTLLAAKLLRSIGNEGSSRLGVRATFEMVAPIEQVLMQRTTSRAPWTAPIDKAGTTIINNSGILNLPMGSRIHYRIHNYSDAPVYFILLGIDTNGNAIALLPSHIDEVETNLAEKQIIYPGEEIIVPQLTSPFKWLVQGPTGRNEMQLILCRKPLTQTFAVLESTQHPRGDVQRFGALLGSLEVAKAVLEDLHQASLPATESIGASSDTFALDMNAWASFTFIYQVF